MIGNYIVDFVSYDHCLIIELDGGQHAEPEQKAFDVVRDEWLRSEGFTVLRFWNDQIHNEADSVKEVIWRELARIAAKQEE